MFAHMTFIDWYNSRSFKTQQACADKLKLHKSTISRMLNDADYVPDRATALYIEAVTKVVKADSWAKPAPKRKMSA
jgi:hypothetical protein